MANFPKFKSPELNALVRALRPLLNVSVRRGDGLVIKKSESGIEFGLNKHEFIPEPSGLKIRSVAIVSTIGDEDTAMTVREVGYADSPPGESLLFTSDTFPAYPYFGDVTIEDYRGLEFTGERPDETTRVLDARKRGNDWILERPSVEAAAGGTKMAKAVGVFSQQSETMLVQDVRFDFTSRELEDVGTQYEVKLWPKLVGADFEFFDVRFNRPGRNK